MAVVAQGVGGHVAARELLLGGDARVELRRQLHIAVEMRKSVKIRKMREALQPRAALQTRARSR